MAVTLHGQQPMDCSSFGPVERGYSERWNSIATDWQLDRVDQRALPLDGVAKFAGDSGGSVDIYVVDTGIDPFHTSLYPRVRGGFSPFDDGYGWTDDHGHGTAVAWLAASVAPAASLYSVRVFKNGVGQTSDVVAGFFWIWERILSRPGRRAVVNYSGGGSPQPPIDRAVCDVINLGVPVYVAAGNGQGTGFDACFVSPARLIQAHTAGALDRYDEPWPLGNSGPCVDYWAPGVDIEIPFGAGTIIASGTSFASPLGAGGAARGLPVLEQLSQGSILFLGFFFRDDFEAGALGAWSHVGGVPND